MGRKLKSNNVIGGRSGFQVSNTKYKRKSILQDDKKRKWYNPTDWSSRNLKKIYSESNPLAGGIKYTHKDFINFKEDVLDKDFLDKLKLEDDYFNSIKNSHNSEELDESGQPTNKEIMKFLKAILFNQKLLMTTCGAAYHPLFTVDTFRDSKVNGMFGLYDGKLVYPNPKAMSNMHYKDFIDQSTLSKANKSTMWNNNYDMTKVTISAKKNELHIVYRELNKLQNIVLIDMLKSRIKKNDFEEIMNKIDKKIVAYKVDLAKKHGNKLVEGMGGIERHNPEEELQKEREVVEERSRARVSKVPSSQGDSDRTSPSVRTESDSSSVRTESDSSVRTVVNGGGDMNDKKLLLEPDNQSDQEEQEQEPENQSAEDNEKTLITQLSQEIIDLIIDLIKKGKPWEDTFWEKIPEIINSEDIIRKQCYIYHIIYYLRKGVIKTGLTYKRNCPTKLVLSYNANNSNKIDGTYGEFFNNYLLEPETYEEDFYNQIQNIKDRGLSEEETNNLIKELEELKKKYNRPYVSQSNPFGIGGKKQWLKLGANTAKGAAAAWASASVGAAPSNAAALGTKALSTAMGMISGGSNNKERLKHKKRTHNKKTHHKNRTQHKKITQNKIRTQKRIYKKNNKLRTHKKQRK